MSIILLGHLRRNGKSHANEILNFLTVCYVLVYALWLQKGYQEFTRVESSITVKIKGVTKSELGEDTNNNPGEF